MEVVLTIDRGNSRTKLAVWNRCDEHPLRVMTLKAVSHSDLSAICGGYRLVGAAYCSVGDDNNILLSRVRALTANVVEVTPFTSTPLTMGYASPLTLGADRLAAAVGAYSMAGAQSAQLLVVDLGTAITYDLVENAVYRGGNIAAGLSMRLKALNAFTARLPLVDALGTVETWGIDTVSALRSGAINGVVGELSHYRSLLRPDARVVVTGGSAEFIVPHLGFDVMSAPHLVSYGLKVIFAHNNPQIMSVSVDKRALAAR